MPNDRDLGQTPASHGSDREGPGGWSLDDALAREAERYRELVRAMEPGDDLAKVREESRARIAQLLRHARLGGGTSESPGQGTPDETATPASIPAVPPNPQCASGAEELSRLCGQIADAERETQAMRQEQQELLDLAARWRARAEETGRRTGELDAPASALTSEVERLRQRKNTHAEATEAIEARVAESEARRAALEAEVAAATSLLEEATHRAVELNVRSAAAEVRSAALDTQAAAAASREDAIQRELRDAATTHDNELAGVSELRAALAAERDRADAMEQAADEARARFEAIQVEFQRERERRARLELDVVDAKECLHRATELLLHSPVAPPGAEPSGVHRSPRRRNEPID